MQCRRLLGVVLESHTINTELRLLLRLIYFASFFFHPYISVCLTSESFCFSVPVPPDHLFVHSLHVQPEPPYLSGVWLSVLRLSAAAQCGHTAEPPFDHHTLAEPDPNPCVWKEHWHNWYTRWHLGQLIGIMSRIPARGGGKRTEIHTQPVPFNLFIFQVVVPIAPKCFLA